MFSIKHNKVDNRLIIESRKAFNCINFDIEILEKAFGLTILAMIEQPLVLFNTMKEENDSDFQGFEVLF